MNKIVSDTMYAININSAMMVYYYTSVNDNVVQSTNLKLFQAKYLLKFSGWLHRTPVAAV